MPPVQKVGVRGDTCLHVLVSERVVIRCRKLYVCMYPPADYMLNSCAVFSTLGMNAVHLFVSVVCSGSLLMGFSQHTGHEQGVH